MSETVIRCESLSKRYKLGLTRHDLLSEKVMAGAKGIVCIGQRLFMRTRDLSDEAKINQQSVVSGHDGYIWALKDVSFEIKRGEVVGIIGANGAGKSTLLKILTAITEPTEGKVWMKGRVGSLLEVGTGFHQELTGRENIFLNGAILGMTRAEIKKKFDEIIAFAEIEEFIDTPVKRYSSGMYVRLAFAVAAHLEPEILLVDEVLSVGDEQFQRKCLGKMKDVLEQGRTILFVSHNMAAVESLCSRCLVLKHGMKAFWGGTPEAIRFYLNSLEGISKDINNMRNRKGLGNIRITGVNIEDQHGNENVPFAIGSGLRVILNYSAKEAIRNPRIIIGVYDEMDVGLARFDSDIAGGFPSVLKEKGQIVCSTEIVNFVPGRYSLNIAVFSGAGLEDYGQNMAIFDIFESDYFQTGKMFDKNERNQAKVLLKHRWMTT